MIGNTWPSKKLIGDIWLALRESSHTLLPTRVIFDSLTVMGIDFPSTSPYLHNVITRQLSNFSNIIETGQLTIFFRLVQNRKSA